MATLRLPFFFILILSFLIGCRQNSKLNSVAITEVENQIEYAKGLQIYPYAGFTVVKVTNPWPNATQVYTYILHQKNAVIPDSLKQFASVVVPISNIVVTSTTHIPSLEMLGVEKTLVGFPNLDYISSEKVRQQIDLGKIKELGSNQTLNTEVILDLNPDVMIGYGIDNKNPTLDNLQKSGLKIMLNGDWNEQTPLGKAEWIKFFAVFYGLEDKAAVIFSDIEQEYLNTVALAKSASRKPTILAGDMFEGQWYLPQGTSWGSQLLKEGQGDYLWADTSGTGSLALSFEVVFEKARNADIWITSGQFGSLQQMIDANPHYSQFKAFQNKNVYSFSNKKGKTGGILYYELAPNRPDIVIKDIVKVLHPELLPNYQPYFFEKLK